ncbi:MAG: hypothetical protein ACI9TH_001696 [Kiritimatiellia bacterium]
MFQQLPETHHRANFNEGVGRRIRVLYGFEGCSLCVALFLLSVNLEEHRQRQEHRDHHASKRLFLAALPGSVRPFHASSLSAQSRRVTYKRVDEL